MKLYLEIDQHTVEEKKKTQSNERALTQWALLRIDRDPVTSRTHLSNMPVFHVTH
jgi:hypothetical protein